MGNQKDFPQPEEFPSKEEFPQFDPTQPDMQEQPDSLYEIELFQRGHQILYQQAYKELCKAVTGDEPLDTPPEEGKFAAQVLEFLKKNRKLVHDKVCVKLEYCKKRKKYGYYALTVPMLFKLTGLIADIIVGCGYASTSWIMIRGILDEFCEC